MIRGDRRQRIFEMANAFGNIPLVGVETGTWRGDTTCAMSKVFGEVFTIDISMKCFKEACIRFSGNHNVYCLFGCSGEILRHLCLQIEEPAFWLLDAHYPFNWFPEDTEHLPDYSPCPLFDELKHIDNRPFRDIVAVDDASGFGKHGYWKCVTQESILGSIHSEQSKIMYDTFVLETVI